MSRKERITALCRYCLPFRTKDHSHHCELCGGWRNPSRKQARITHKRELSQQ